MHERDKSSRFHIAQPEKLRSIHHGFTLGYRIQPFWMTKWYSDCISGGRVAIPCPSKYSQPEYLKSPSTRWLYIYSHSKHTPAYFSKFNLYSSHSNQVLPFLYNHIHIHSIYIIHSKWVSHHTPVQQARSHHRAPGKTSPPSSTPTKPRCSRPATLVKMWDESGTPSSKLPNLGWKSALSSAS